MDGMDGGDFGYPGPLTQDIKALQGFPGGSSTFLRADRTFAAPPGGAGGLNKGTATLDFSTGNAEASVAVTGQGAIAADSLVAASKRLVTTAAHSADEARMESLEVTAGNISPGAGFTIYGHILQGRAQGAYTVNWWWA